MNNTIVYVLIAGFTVALGLVAYFRNPKDLMSELKVVAEMAVAAIEQTVPGATNEQKLSTALEWIAKTGKFSGVSETLIRMAIEAAVKIIKYPGVTFSPSAVLDTIETGINPAPVEYHDTQGSAQAIVK